MTKPKVIFYGDGAIDDTIALQTWIDSKPVYYPNGDSVSDVIKDKKLRISSLTIPANSTGSIISCEFIVLNRGGVTYVQT